MNTDTDYLIDTSEDRYLTPDSSNTDELEYEPTKQIHHQINNIQSKNFEFHQPYIHPEFEQMIQTNPNSNLQNPLTKISFEPDVLTCNCNLPKTFSAANTRNSSQPLFFCILLFILETQIQYNRLLRFLDIETNLIGLLDWLNVQNILVTDNLNYKNRHDSTHTIKYQTAFFEFCINITSEIQDILIQLQQLQTRNFQEFINPGIFTTTQSNLVVLDIKNRLITEIKRDITHPFLYTQVENILAPVLQLPYTPFYLMIRTPKIFPLCDELFVYTLLQFRANLQIRIQSNNSMFSMLP